MAITTGSEVNVTYGSGLFVRTTTGKVIEVMDEGKFRVEVFIGNSYTWVISSIVSLIDEPEPDLTKLGEELNPETELETPVEEPKKERKPRAKKDAVENLAESVEKKTEAEPVSVEVVDDKWMKPLRYDMEFLGPLPTTYRIAGRQKIRGIRHYVVCFEDQPEPWFLGSVTSLIDQVMPKDEQFIRYMVDNFNSYDEFKSWLDEKAGFGTVVHGAIADFVNGVLPDFDDREGWYGYLSIACERAGHKSKANLWMSRVQESVIDFWQWVHDYQVKFILLEQPLASRKWGLAGQLDLLVEMNSHIQKKTGKNAAVPHRVLAIVDIKTGNAMDRYNGQLGMYGGMLFETFPGLKRIIAEKYPQQVIDGEIRLEYGIITPKSFRTEPKYTFVWRTEQVHKYMEKKFQKHLDLFLMDLKKPGHVRSFVGKPDLSQPVAGTITYKTLEQEWIDRIREGNYGEDVEIVTEEDDDGEEES